MKKTPYGHFSKVKNAIFIRDILQIAVVIGFTAASGVLKQFHGGLFYNIFRAAGEILVAIPQVTTGPKWKQL